MRDFHNSCRSVADAASRTSRVFVLVTQGDDPIALLIEPGLEPVDLDQQNRLGIQRKAEMECLLDGHQDALVHHFQSGRHDASADNGANRIRGIGNRFEDAQHGAPALWIARQSDPGLGDDGQSPLAADKQAGQVEPRGVFGRAAELHDLAVGQDSLDPQHVIHRYAVLERVRPARIRGHVAADGASPLARGVGCIVITSPFQGLGKPHIDHAWLHHGVAIAEIDLDNLSSYA